MEGKIGFLQCTTSTDICGDDFDDDLNIFQEGSPELCVIINQQYQQMINQELYKLENILQNNLEEQKKLMEEHENNSSQKSGFVIKTNRKPITLFAAPYFRDIRGRIAPENEDAIIKRKRGDVDAYLMQPRPWTSSEHAVLARAVYDNAVRVLVKPLVNRVSFLQTKMANEILSEVETEEMNNMIAVLRQEIEGIKQTPKMLLVEDIGDNLDWLKISTVDMAGTRSPEECEGMWLNFLNPKINRKKFAPIEDRRLITIAQRHDERNWDSIAALLNTERTAIQCIQRFQSHLNSNMLKKYWTPEEDKILKAVVEACRVGDHIPWEKVTYYMDGRTRTQVLNRWNRNIIPESHGRPWCKEEDAVLYAAFQRFGNNWQKVAEYLPGRTNFQCRERYSTVLASGIIFGGWTLEEDRKLLRLIAQYGEGKWALFSRHFQNRTDLACCQRAARLKKQNLKQYNLFITKWQTGVAEEDLMPEQITRSKQCPAINAERKRLREEAIATFKEAMLSINSVQPGQLDGKIKVSAQNVKQLSEELLSRCDHPKCEDQKEPTYEVLHRYMRKELMKREELAEKYGMIDLSSSEEEEEEEESLEQDVNSEEEAELNHQLDCLFIPRAAAGFVKFKKKAIVMTPKETVEYEVLRSIIFKAFNIETEPVETSVFNGIDYGSSIQRLIDMLVLPPAENGMLPVVPPNLCNLTGMLIFFVTRKLLESTARGEVSPRAIENFKAIALDFPDIVRKCQFCRAVTQQKQVNEGDVCECDLLKELRLRYILLKERFLSMFLWPALLSGVKMTDLQIQNLVLCNPLAPKLEESPTKSRKRRHLPEKKKCPKRLKREDKPSMFVV